MMGGDRFSNRSSPDLPEEALSGSFDNGGQSTHRESADSQIMAFARAAAPAPDPEQEKILRDVLGNVDFGCPVGSKDEMAEVHRLARMY